MIGNSGSEFSTLGTKDRKRDFFFRHTHTLSVVFSKESKILCQI